MKIIDKIKELFNKVLKKQEIKQIEAPEEKKSQSFEKVWKETLKSETPQDRFYKILEEDGVVLSNPVKNKLFEDLFNDNKDLESLSWGDKDLDSKMDTIIRDKWKQCICRNGTIYGPEKTKIDEVLNQQVGKSQNVYQYDTVMQKEANLADFELYASSNFQRHSQYRCFSTEKVTKYDPTTAMEVYKSEETAVYRGEEGQNDPLLTYIRPDMNFDSRKKTSATRDESDKSKVILKVEENGENKEQIIKVDENEKLSLVDRAETEENEQKQEEENEK